MNKNLILDDLLLAFKRISGVMNKIQDEEQKLMLEVVLAFNISNSIYELIGTREEQDVDVLEKQLRDYVESHDHVSAEEFLKAIDFYLRRQNK